MTVGDAMLFVASLTQVHLLVHAVEVGYLVRVVRVSLEVHTRFAVGRGWHYRFLLQLYHSLKLGVINLWFQNLLDIGLLRTGYNLFLGTLVKASFDLNSIEEDRLFLVVLGHRGDSLLIFGLDLEFGLVAVFIE